MSSDQIIRLTICGGGNGTHTLAGISSMNENLQVTVLDIFEDEAERWAKASSLHGFTVLFPSGSKLQQAPGNVKFKVTRNVVEAITPANIVIICIPAFAHDVYLKCITPYLSDGCLVVGMPGQPGFEYQCLYYLRNHGKKCSVITLETLPWACRLTKYGEEVMIMGTKDEVGVSLITQSEACVDPISIVQRVIGKTPVLKQASNAVEIAMLAKAIIHPPIMFARWRDWTGEELDSPPLFYQGVDQRASEYLDAACNEVIDVANKLQQEYPQMTFSQIGTMQDWLINHYGDQIWDKSTLLTALKTNKAYDGLVHPMTKTSSGKYVPNFSYRYITEDVPYGLVVMRAIAEMVEVKTPITDEIIIWAQGKLGEEFLVNGKINEKCSANTRIPQKYGLHTVDDIIQYCGSQ